MPFMIVDGIEAEEALMETAIAAVKDWDKPITRDTIADIVEAISKNFIIKMRE